MKGINKLVLEVKPDDKYFERALLFLKPEKINLPQKEISDGAEKLLNEINQPKNVQQANKPFIFIILGGISGILFTFISLFLSGLLSF